VADPLQLHLDVVMHNKVSQSAKLVTSFLVANSMQCCDEGCDAEGAFQGCTFRGTSLTFVVGSHVQETVLTNHKLLG
jgi:hypothetical protein